MAQFRYFNPRVLIAQAGEQLTLDRFASQVRILAKTQSDEIGQFDR